MCTSLGRRLSHKPACLKGTLPDRNDLLPKNNKGCIPDYEKRRFHSLGLHGPIAALAAKLRPSLYIIDSICGDLNFEEGGTPIQTNRMLLGHDPVQLDAYGCSLMGIDLHEVKYIRYAEEWGAGSAILSEEDIIRLNPPEVVSAYPCPSGMVAKLTKNVDQRSACSACFGNLVHALYRMEHEYHRTYKGNISIGQEFKGMTCKGIGIGYCCKNAESCVLGCPPSADDIIDTLMKEKEAIILQGR